MATAVGVGVGIYTWVSWCLGVSIGVAHLAGKTAAIGSAAISIKAAAGGTLLATKTVVIGSAAISGKATLTGAAVASVQATTGGGTFLLERIAVTTASSLQKILFAVNCLSKTCSVIETAFDIHEVVNSTELTQNEKSHRIATCVLFVILQTVDIGVGIANNSSTIKIAAKIGAGSAHFVKACSKKVVQENFTSKDIIDLLCIAAFRGGDITGFMASELPEQYKNLKDSADLLQALALLGMNRKSVISALKVLAQWASACTASGDENRRQLDEVLKANRIEDFTKIPDLFSSDQGLTRWICPITRKPIRFALVVSATKNTDHPILYEKSAIEQWMLDNPRKVPKGWPLGVRVRTGELVSSEFHQTLIDESLTLLLEGVKELYLEDNLEVWFLPP